MFISVGTSVFVFGLWLEAIITTQNKKILKDIPSLPKLVFMDGFGYLDKK